MLFVQVTYSPSYYATLFCIQCLISVHFTPHFPFTTTICI